MRRLSDSRLIQRFFRLSWKIQPQNQTCVGDSRIESHEMDKVVHGWQTEITSEWVEQFQFIRCRYSIECDQECQVECAQSFHNHIRGVIRGYEERKPGRRSVHSLTLFVDRRVWYSTGPNSGKGNLVLLCYDWAHTAKNHSFYWVKARDIIHVHILNSNS